MVVDLAERPCQGRDDVLRGEKIAIVRAVLAGILPDAFGGIELGRVGQEFMHREPGLIAPEPGPHGLVLVVGRVVLDENRAAAAVAERQVIEKGQVRVGVEHDVPPVVKRGVVKVHGPEDLDAFAGPSDRHLRGGANATPGGVERRVLPKARLIGEDQRPVLALGFFLRLGYV